MDKDEISKEFENVETASDKGVSSTGSLGIDIWHPFNGKWVHIVQIVENGIRKYYTDGRLTLSS